METFGTGSFHLSVKNGGQKKRLEKITSIVACLAANQVCDQIRKDFQYNKPPLLSRVVSDKNTVEACIQFANEHRFLVGLACGTALCALYNGFVERILNYKETHDELRYDLPTSKDFHHNSHGPVVVIVCGGSEIDLDLINQYKEQFGISM